MSSVGAGVGDGPNTVSESTVSNTKLSEFVLVLAEFRGEGSVSSSEPISVCVCVCQSKLTEFFAELTELPQNSVSSLFRNSLGGRFEYFLFFSARGRGRGSPRRQKGAGVGFLLKTPRGGGFSHKREGGGRGARRVSEGNFGGGDLNIFFRGRNAHQAVLSKQYSARLLVSH